MNRIIYPRLLSIVVMLSACGGGGGGDGVSPDSAASSGSSAGQEPTAGQETAAGQDPAAAALSPAPAATPDSGTTLAAGKTCGFVNFEEQLLAQINQARATPRTCGTVAFPAVAPLAWNSRLYDAGTAHAADMASNNYFSHVSLDGRLFSQRIDAAGYAWAAAGENIAAGQDSVEQVVAEWLASPGHCANIMEPDFTEIGVACVRNDGAGYRYYWAMELGSPR